MVNNIVPGSRLLVLGPRCSGKTTIMEHLPKLLADVPSLSTHAVGAFAVTSKALERLAVYCCAPRHRSHHRVVLIDDVECFSSPDITSIRKHMRSHPDITFVLTTSTAAGLQESLVAQCNVVQLTMPRLDDLRNLGGPECTPVCGMSLGSACNQRNACALVGRKLRWRERCEAPATIAAVGAVMQEEGECARLLAEAHREVDELFMNGWSCGDMIETMHAALVQGTWGRDLECLIAQVLLKYSTWGDRPDMSSAMAYLMVIDLAAAASRPRGVAPRARCSQPGSSAGSLS